MGNVKRDVWVDNVKVVACILVVLGHFFQSMVKSNLMIDSFWYEWFEHAIYYFHVPLFFICSGYLYQKYSKVDDISSWINSIKKKSIALGVPYFTFSFATWGLKKVFASSVNDQIGGLADTLLNHPTSPYWYLYILFIMFLVTWNTYSRKNQLMLLVIATILKLASVYGVYTNVYFIDKLFENWVWFVIGMCLAQNLLIIPSIPLAICMIVIFILGTLSVAFGAITFKIAGFALGLIACFAVLGIVVGCFVDGKQIKIFELAGRYTMPIFLMHTLFAAPFRSVLLKLGIDNLVVHITLGLMVSIVGPIISMVLLEKLKPLDGFVYPTRYVNIGKKELKND